ncbi:hypothetical protein H9P43_008542 [Blastocladiella emersonii ATCC 22665]|nr:hypothetical protein H9P43_008542 [Blastocladiella emersonii ATCC 22665]
MESTTTAPSDQPPRRANRLLQSYYGTVATAGNEGGSTSALNVATGVGGTGTLDSPSTPKRTEATDPDADGFDPDKYLKILLNEKTLPGLLKRDNDLIVEMKQLDGDRKTLVYENYSKLIDASDTIKRMRDKVESVEAEMAKLSMQVQDITSLASNLHGTFTHRKTRVHALKNTISLLRRLQVLATLPRRLAQSLKDGSYLRTVQFYAASKPTLDRCRHIPLFDRVAVDAQAAVALIRTTILNALKNPAGTPLLIEYLKVLIAVREDSPAAILELFRDGAMRIVTNKITNGDHWLAHLHSLVEQADRLFRPAPDSPDAPPSPSPTPTSPNAIFTLAVSPDDLALVSDTLDAVVRDAFAAWDRAASISRTSLGAHVAAHRDLRATLETVPRIAHLVRAASDAAIAAHIAAALDAAITGAVAAVHAALDAANPEAAGSAMHAAVTGMYGQMEALVAAVAAASESEAAVRDRSAPVWADLDAAVPRFMDRALAARESTSSSDLAQLVQVRLAQMVGDGSLNAALDRFPSLLGLATDAAAAEDYVAHATSIARDRAAASLAQFLAGKIRVLEATVAGNMRAACGGMHAPHPRGVSPAWIATMQGLGELAGTVARLFPEPALRDSASADADSVRSVRRAHRATGSYSGSSLASLAQVTGSGGSGSGGAGRYSPTASMTPADRAALAGVTKLFSERIAFYPTAAGEIDGDRAAITAVLLRVVAKAWVEGVRRETLGKNGFQQLLVDVEYARIQLRAMGAVAVDRATTDLLDEVVTSAYRRCVEPVFLSRDAISAVLGASDVGEQEGE